MFDPVHDYVFVEWWVRRSKWFRIATAVIVLVPGVVICRGNLWAGAIIVAMGVAMLAHGIFAAPEHGPH